MTSRRRSRRAGGLYGRWHPRIGPRWFGLVFNLVLNRDPNREWWQVIKLSSTTQRVGPTSINSRTRRYRTDLPGGFHYVGRRR